MATRTTKSVKPKQKAESTKGAFLGLRKMDIAVIVVTLVLVGFGAYNRFLKKPLCALPGAEHVLTLKDDAFSQSSLVLNQCDVIKVVNLDTQIYELAFGVYESHINYPGYIETQIRPNEFIAIDALQAGDYRLHDHLRDKASIEFSIRAR